MAETHVLDILKRLEGSYPSYDLTTVVIDDFVRVFSETSAEVLEEARQAHVARSVYFPKLSEFRQYVREIEEREADKAREAREALFWTAERRDLWRRLVEHSLTCQAYSTIFGAARRVEVALATGAAHLASCDEPQAVRPEVAVEHTYDEPISGEAEPTARSTAVGLTPVGEVDETAPGDQLVRITEVGLGRVRRSAASKQKTGDQS